MSSGRGSDMEAGAHKPDKSAKFDPDKHLADMPDEMKHEWLKRRAKEERSHKQKNVVVDEWFELVAGKKLIKKIKKASGGVYSIYICNVTKKQNAGVMAQLVKQADGTYRKKARKKDGPKKAEGAEE